MKGINKVILVGTVGKDPEVRYGTNGNAMCSLSMATSESWKDQQGQKQEKTEWHNLVFYRKLAEIVGQYVKKGSKLYIEGKLQTRKWQDKSGQDRYTTEIVADQMQMLDSPSQNNGQYQQQAQQQSQYQPQQQYQQPQQQQYQQQMQQQQQQYPQNNQGVNFDDSIPF